MTATTAEVQALIDATPTGGTVALPEVVHIDATAGPLVVPRSMTITGPSTITTTPPTAKATTVVEVTAPNGFTVAFRGFTVVGPDTPAVDVTLLRWWLPRSQDSTMIVDGVTVTGQFNEIPGSRRPDAHHRRVHVRRLRPRTDSLRCPPRHLRLRCEHTLLAGLARLAGQHTVQSSSGVGTLMWTNYAPWLAARGTVT